MSDENGQTGEPGTALARSEGEYGTLVRRAARLPAEEWPDERIGVIARTIAPPEAGAAEVAMLLAVANNYQLDPILKEIWLAKGDDGRLHILTGRDSFLTVAERQPGYLGHESDVVYEQDEFTVERKGGDITVHHAFDGIDRGPIKGAYSLVRVEGKPPVLITRLFSDYDHLHGKKNWRQYPKDMLLARVIVAAHRLAVKIRGVYTPDELADPLFEDGTTSVEGKAVEKGTRARLQKLKGELGQKSATERGREIVREVEEDLPTLPEQEGPPEPPMPEGDGPTSYERAKRRYFACWAEHGEPTGMARSEWQGDQFGKLSAAHFSEEEFIEAAARLERGVGLPTAEVAVDDDGRLPV